MKLSAQYYGANGWLLDFVGLRVLVDPWLRGNLSFPPGKWLLNGVINTELPIPEKIDILLLSQGLADHAHKESLKLLPKNIPVIGSKNAAEVVKELGFKTIYSLKPGETLEKLGVKIKATSGAPVPFPENGYLISHKNCSIYFEPHGFLDPKIEEQKLDVVISPVIDLKLPLLGAFIKGQQVIPRLQELFKPKYILATTTGGDITFKGIIGKLLSSFDITINRNQEFYKNTKLINPKHGGLYNLK